MKNEGPTPRHATSFPKSKAWPLLRPLEIAGSIAARWPIEPVQANYFGEVAERWRFLDGAGEIGIISSVTQPFCGSCTLARLSADGKLYRGVVGFSFATSDPNSRPLARNSSLWSEILIFYPESRSFVRNPELLSQIVIFRTES